MTRRFFLMAGVAGAAEPWRKNPSEWNATEKRAVLNKSPWAITTRVEFVLNGQDVEGPRSGGVVGPPEGPPGGNGTVGPPGGGPARAGGGIKQNGPGVLPEFKAVVRWESALPVQMALKNEATANYQYVIAVIGFPLLRNDLAGSLSTLKTTSRLERMAGRDSLRPSRVESRDTDLVIRLTGRWIRSR